MLLPVILFARKPKKGTGALLASLSDSFQSVIRCCKLADPAIDNT